MMKQNLSKILASLLLASFILTACAPAATPAPTAVPATAAPAATVAPTTVPAAAGKVCEVTDIGGVNDKSFNALAWIGAQAAAKNQGWDAAFLESKQQTDYEKNLNEYLKGGCNLIVTVGFLMGDATKAAATANPTQKFQALDIGYDMTTTTQLTGVWQQLYATEQGGFLAGYAAASQTKTGKIGTFGGINFPAVSDFMVGFQQGMEYYNTKHSAKVVLLGWDNAKKDGLFTGDFSDKDKGKTLAQNLLDEGADIIMPVAGSVGLGAAAAVQANGKAMLVGVDQDWFISAPEYDSIVLTSVQKRLDQSVQAAAKAVGDGSFKGGVHVGTLATGEIGIAPFHNFDAQVSQTIKDELTQIAADISSGKIVVKNFVALP
jgi:basic membrane protein A